MSIIPCGDDCVYQKEGYCMLEMPTAITNNTSTGCVHYIKLNKSQNKQGINSKSQKLV